MNISLATVATSVVMLVAVIFIATLLVTLFVRFLGKKRGQTVARTSEMDKSIIKDL